MDGIERSAELPVIYIGAIWPPGYGRRGVVWRERSIIHGREYTDPPGIFFFRPDDEPSMTTVVHRDDLVPRQPS